MRKKFYFSITVDLKRQEVVGVMCTYVKWILQESLRSGFLEMCS
jgi:hypothetical protein